tara:strand:- start:124 stop:366 length:243 start_codon:yes stop_codon:yes gene_type:complete
MKNIFFYPIICALIYNNIKTYLENKKKFIDIFNKIEMMNTKINRVRTLIDTRKVHFNNNKQTYTLSPLDVDENSYSSEEC